MILNGTKLRSNESKSSMADWASDLPQDLIAYIAQRMDLMQDLITFGLVCKTWSCAATKENFTRVFTHQVPLLMLSDLEDNGVIPSQCYNITKGKVCSLNIPKTIAQRRLAPWCRSSLGWLIIASSQFSTSNSKHIYLLHPFKHEEILLPTLESRCIKKFVLSSSPSLTLDYTVMVSTSFPREFAFWRPKDNEWTKISSELNPLKSDGRSYDIAFYKGQFYIIELDGRVLVCDIDDPKKAKARVVVTEMTMDRVSVEQFRQFYLVESAGALLLVFRFRGTSRSLGFRVFEVPLSTGNWSDSKEVHSLGNRALFLSLSNSSFSIEVSDYSGCIANCIYFARHLDPAYIPMHQDLGVFSMKDEKVKPLVKRSLSIQNPYLWIQPSF